MNWKEFFEFLFTNKVIKVTVICIFIIIGLFAALLLYKAAIGQHIKVFGIELYNETEKIDTSNKTQRSASVAKLIDTGKTGQSKSDTFNKKLAYKPTLPFHKKEPSRFLTRLNNSDPSAKKANSEASDRKDTSKSDIYDLKGATLNGSAIGRNPIVNNFNETHLDDEEKKREINSIGYYKQLWKVTNDTIVISHTQNSNGAVFQYEMSKFLRESGYPVIELNGWTVSKQPIIGLEIQKAGDKLNFIIGTLVKK